MHMKLHGWKTVSGFLFTVAIGSIGFGSSGAGLGCSATASGSASSGGDDVITPPAGCQQDSTVDCSGGGDGFSCDTGDNPEAEDSSLSCSTPTSSAGEDDYCCFTAPSGFGDSSCAPDDDLTAVCPDPDSYGYQCDTGDDPSTLDSSLNCSQSTPDSDGMHDDFCCTLGASSSSSSSGSSSGGDDSSFGTGCVADDSLGCADSATGISCPGGTVPDDSAGICSDPTTNSDGTDGFCCITIADTGCSQDDSVTGCEYPSFGFSCTSGSPDPSTEDSSLNCSQPTSDPDGNDDYCCAPM
jgi:hypothetical protein